MKKKTKKRNMRKEKRKRRRYHKWKEVMKKGNKIMEIEEGKVSKDRKVGSEDKEDEYEEGGGGI